MIESEYRSELVDLADLLQVVEACLERSWSGQHASFQHCDEWCKLWMLLAGAWYSLSWAVYSVEKDLPLKDSLPEAHAFARKFLKSQPSSLAAAQMNPWFCGYFLISGEHRIASTIDRLTRLFFYPKHAEYGIYSRCDSLVKGCPHCQKQASLYLPNAYDILAKFAAHPKLTGISKADWKASSAIATVYDRVNTIKHKRPDADAVSDLPTATRWRDAATGIRELAVLMQDLTKHWIEDAPYAEGPPNEGMHLAAQEPGGG